MRTSTLFLASYATRTYAFSIPPLPHLHFLGVASAGQQQQPLQDTLDTWIQQEERIALDRLLANVSPGGRNVEGQGVAHGTVVASPSQDGPDYWYQWVRDAAITMNTLVDVYADDTSSPFAASLSTTLDAYTSLQQTIQHTPNPSGRFDDLSGLGEPKFEIDGTPFTGSWGRPQRDGPALRALTLIHYLREYNASHPTLWTSSRADDFFASFYEASMPPTSVIKADLEYVSHFWNQSGFDLWEEVEGLHFFTLMVSARSLREGSQIARAFGDLGAADWYTLQAGYIENLLSKFWNKQKGHLVETLWSKRSGLDCGLLLGSLHALPADGSDEDTVYPPWSDEVLVSLLALTRDQKDRFPINSSPQSSSGDDDDEANADDEQPFEGTGLGRYPEDKYNGYSSTHHGNPWFLCTSSAAEILYRTASHFSSISHLTISPTSLPFYTSLLASSSLDIDEGTYGPSDALFHSILERLRAVGDQFLAVVRSHVDAEGSMSEQFDQNTGFMTGARDLTWSYGAFLQAVRARKRAMSA
ncbi:Glucan 1,4-alpha-glucosidase [Ascochyta rabiei]|uniref:glucan 1,4-alpha-glucosidase n=1 Tax=Didymella rabiei TaxID=5454 RepID=A0A163EY18_DIDRA|nr:Glucan 1,4-alpha-glucosidase [Ascochyta rabiei]KZM24008.1 glucan 1,4-alpha-glucosidase [Ascochyta rabiei]UPX19111.1 Glucan 1,4-alpha-glucosidase [Ascochyta rabiei]